MENSKRYKFKVYDAHYWSLATFVFLGCISTACLPGTRAQGVDPLFRGNSVTISVGFSVGGGYDLHARLLARHIGNHLPGRPSVLVKNSPGGAGLVLVNNLYNKAPKDGTEIATFDRAIALEPLLDGSNSQFDPLKMTWIGSTDADASTCFSWHTSSVKTIEDLRTQELIISATGSVGDAVSFPKILNATLGTRFRIISGYPGSNDALLSIERGETSGYCSMGFSSLMAVRPNWLRDGKINILVQLSLHKSLDFPNTPLALDLATTEADRQAIALIVAPNQFARPFAGPPGMSTAHSEAWRSAFARTVSDQNFLTEAQTSGVKIRYVSGQEIDDLLALLYKTPREVLDRVRQALR